MTDVLTFAALALAWFAFRFDRHRRWSDALEAAYGSLRAVHHGMVQGLTAGQAAGWGQLYFSTDYDDLTAVTRAEQTRNSVRAGGVDQVFVVPTEPLAKLATATPHEHLVTYKTIAIANFALWRLHGFNQLVRQLTDFYTANITEITTGEEERRKEIAEAAMFLSWVVHHDGIGRAWSVLPDGGRGWYGELVEAIGENMTGLDSERRSRTRRSVTAFPYVVVDVLVAVGLVTVIVMAL